MTIREEVKQHPFFAVWDEPNQLLKSAKFNCFFVTKMKKQYSGKIFKNIPSYRVLNSIVQPQYSTLSYPESVKK
ncbi:hypothetical protein [Neobacillus sp. 114]|uniref:hypothetical protein n=1 Tax=Neobacillus sp. 114 TaxID=3048535 RepID=UPI0024C3D2E4|nr:hypothetical protein [Neobacillus sp. 114]